MDSRSFNRLAEGTDILLIVNDLALCKINNILLEVDDFPTSKDNQLIARDVKGTFITSDLDEVAYNGINNAMIVINKKSVDHDYNIVLFKVGISTNNKLEGNTEYSYIAKAMRILHVEGEKWIKKD